VEIDLDLRLCPHPIPGKKTQIKFREQVTIQLPPAEGLGGHLSLNRNRFH
jgi:hypothetical protein